MQFSDSLEANAFRSRGGEYAWLARDAPLAVDEITRTGVPLLGGDVWVVSGATINPAPSTGGRPSVIGWTCDRRPDESLEGFVERSREESLAEIERMAAVPIDNVPEGGEIRFNLTWAKSTTS